MVEHATVNRVVVGSSPTSGASFDSSAATTWFCNLDLETLM